MFNRALRSVSRQLGGSTSTFHSITANSIFTSVLPSSQVLSVYVSRRSYHQNIIDHYETPRNVGM